MRARAVIPLDSVPRFSPSLATGNPADDERRSQRHLSEKQPHRDAGNERSHIRVLMPLNVRGY